MINLKKCYLQNLGIIVTEKCNINCSHCLRGNKTNKNITDSVIDKTFDNIEGIGCLNICGGEPTLALKEIEKIIDYIIIKKIKINNFALTINGTIYSKELLKLLDEIYNYLGKEKFSTLLAISIDKYHLDEVKRLKIEKEFLENIKRYKESKYFYCYRELTKRRKLIREGNAINLDNNLTVPLRKMDTYMTYSYKKKLDKENGLLNIGPIVTINVDGIVTECDASNENQRTIYNYGNIFNNSIEEIFINNNIPILEPKKFEKACQKSIKKYNTYNK